MHAALLASLRNITKKGIVAVGKSLIGLPEAVANYMAKEFYNLGHSSWNRHVTLNNKLIGGQNGGVVDKTFKVEWDELRNMILVTQYGHLKRINTKIQQVMKLDE